MISCFRIIWLAGRGYLTTATHRRQAENLESRSCAIDFRSPFQFACSKMLAEQKESGLVGSDVALAQEFQQKYQALLAEVHRVIIGQEKIIEHLLTVLFARGHALIIGVPGLAKTLLVKTLAGCR